METGLPVSPFLFFGVFLVVVIAVAIGGYVAEQRRRDRLAQFCLAQGWQLLAADTSLVHQWQGTPFGRGESRRASNVIRGVTGDGAPFTCFDYTYETSTTDAKGNRQTTKHRFAVATRRLPAYLGTVEVTPQSIFERAALATGLMTDIDLESEDFNNRFRVRAADRKLAVDLLHPRMMEALLASGAQAWRIEGRDVLTWENGTLQPVLVLRQLALIDRVVGGVPAHVWKDARGDSGDPTDRYDPHAGPNPGGSA
jgi:hypothetical protein